MTTPDRIPWTVWAILSVLVIGLFLAAQTEADATEWVTVDIVPEAGATFDGGICWESDGTQGIAMLDGSCVTPADYDALYGYANLSTVESQTAPGVSIADEAGIAPDGPEASIRPRTFAGIPLDPFLDYIARHHGPQ